MIQPPAGSLYTHFIAQIRAQREAKRYLEIGVQASINLSAIKVDEAIAIDPAFHLSTDPTIGKKSLLMHRMTISRGISGLRSRRP